MAYKMVKQQGSVTSVEEAIGDLQALAEEMRSWADNMEGAGTGLENTEKHQTVSSSADELENIDEIEIPECLVDLDVSVEYTEMVNKNKRRGCSRAVRRDNAVAILSSVKERLEEDDEEFGFDDDQMSEVELFCSALEDVIGYAESAEFPGMFG